MTVGYDGGDQDNGDDDDDEKDVTIMTTREDEWAVGALSWVGGIRNN